MLRKTYLSDLERNINSVHSIEVPDEKGIINCEYYFPNATELTLNGRFLNESKNSLLNNIIPFNQITQLTLDLPRGTLSKIIELLHYSSKSIISHSKRQI